MRKINTNNKRQRYGSGRWYLQLVELVELVDLVELGQLVEYGHLLGAQQGTDPAITEGVLQHRRGNLGRRVRTG